MNPEGAQRAELMVSHSWAESMDECEEALHKFYKRKDWALAVVLWFCAFAQYQPGSEPGDCGPTVSTQLATDPFGSVIRAVCRGLGMVVVQTSTADVYSRLWCVYEIAEAVVSEAPVAMAFSEASLESATGAFEALLRARTAKAKCRDASDEQMIREKVKLSGGFKRLDSVIFTFRLQAFQEMMAELRESVRDELLREIDRFRQMTKQMTTQSSGGLADGCHDKLQVEQHQAQNQKQICLLIFLAPFILVIAVLALPFLILCGPCLAVIYMRRKVQKKAQISSFEVDLRNDVTIGAGTGRYGSSDPVPASPAAPEVSPRKQSGSKTDVWGAGGGGDSFFAESFGDGGDDGEESDDDTLVRDRLAQVFSQAPSIFNR